MRKLLFSALISHRKSMQMHIAYVFAYFCLFSKKCIKSKFCIICIILHKICIFDNFDPNAFENRTIVISARALKSFQCSIPFRFKTRLFGAAMWLSFSVFTDNFFEVKPVPDHSHHASIHARKMDDAPK